MTKKEAAKAAIAVMPMATQKQQAEEASKICGKEVSLATVRAAQSEMPTEAKRQRGRPAKPTPPTSPPMPAKKPMAAATENAAPSQQPPVREVPGPVPAKLRTREDVVRDRIIEFGEYLRKNAETIAWGLLNAPVSRPEKEVYDTVCEIVNELEDYAAESPLAG